MAGKQSLPSLTLSVQDKHFCDAFAAHGDMARALREAGVQVPLTRNPEGVAGDLMARQDIKDYLCVLGVGDDNDIEALVMRMGAMRREAWRRGDVKEARSIDMEVARLRGWLIERIEQKVETTSTVKVEEMSTDELMRRLMEAHSAGLLKQHGVKMLKDGKLDVIDGEYTEVPIDAGR